MDRADGPAIYENEEDQRLARVLSILIWASWGMYLFAICTGLFYKDWTAIIVTLAGCAILILPFVLLRKRQLRACSLALMLIDLGTVTLIATFGQGIRDLAVIAYPIIFIFAGLALDRTMFRLCVGLTLAAVCWLAFGEAFGWFITKLYIGNMTNWFYLVGVTLILLVAALAVELLASNMRSSLARSQREIAQRKQAEEEIRDLNADLEQRVEERTRELREAQERLVRHEKLAVLGQMAGSVGHELRNPLNAINSAVYYLKLVQPEAGEKVKKYHGVIEQEVQNATKIITDLLDFSRLKSADRKPVAIPELVQGMLDRFPVHPAVQVTLEIPADLPMVYADPRQVEQVLGNLVTNAWQAMVSTGTTSGAAGGTLTISARQQEGLVAIAVKDTGVGISPENVGKLFEPLFTTRVTGIGLGLVVSKMLIEANEGRIEVESEPGKGSTFTLVLPVCKE